jgi:uncharacterized lipoprotein YbaY
MKQAVMKQAAMKHAAIGLAVAALLSSCTWVHMAPGASAVRVVTGPPAGCQNRGEVEVSVKDSVAFYDRNALRVQEELETLARNEAPGLGADTVQPLGPPKEGSQRYAAWKCQ